MYKILIILAICVMSVLSIAQERQKETKIVILEDFEHIDIIYTVRMECEDFYTSNPEIAVKNKTHINAILCLVDSLELSKSEKYPDVRIKLKITRKGEEETLCFGRKNRTMIYNGERYVYNNRLASLIIKLIKEYK